MVLQRLEFRVYRALCLTRRLSSFSHNTPFAVSNSYEGGSLNTLAGSGNEEEFGLEDEDFHSDGSNLSPVWGAQKSKLAVAGGSCYNSSQKLMRTLRGSNSKRAEEKFKETHMIFSGPVKVRVMDVDAFNLNELHHYFMFSLVRRFPAEVCIKVAARIAIFRDKNTQHSFESMSKDVANLFGPIYGPELTALFARCYGTIPVPFMLDYTRRFGKFSRRFLALHIDKNMNPRLFDPVRYPTTGVRPLPGIVTRPFALRSFAWLLPPCSAKRYIFQHLIAKSGDEKLMSKLELAADSIDSQVKHKAEFSEKMVASWKKVNRPQSVSKITSDAHSAQPTDALEIIHALETANDKGCSSEIESFVDLQSLPVHAFKSPLMDDTNEIIATGNDRMPEENNLAPMDDSESPSGSWWKARQRSSEFFRHNKKAYRLENGTWKRIPDPRGEPLDYERDKKIRQSKLRIRNTYARLSRQKARRNAIHEVITRKLNS